MRVIRGAALLKGPLKGNLLYYDDEGIDQGQPLNELATRLLGDQVCGGMIFGPVLVFKPETET